MDNIDAFEVLDEINDQIENQEIDLTLDDDEFDMQVAVKHEIEDVNSEEGEREEVNLQEQVKLEQSSLHGREAQLELADPVELEPLEVPDDENEDKQTGEAKQIQETSGLSDENGLLNISDCNDFKSEDETDDKLDVLPHPYLYIVETYEFPKQQLSESSIEALTNHKDANLVMVKSKVALLKMLDDLRTVTEIGLDLKVTSQEFSSTVCFLQISTGVTDYIIDTLKVRTELIMLTELFINPKILKVVFASKTVLPVLQLKLHLFLVNVFDISGARMALGEPRRALNGVLEQELNVKRKTILNVDLRKRPICPEFMDFLHSGVHYLVHLYHIYKNKLIKKDMEEYKQFLEACRDECKQTHSEPKLHQLKVIEEEIQHRHKCELDVAKKLFYWRRAVGKRLNLRPEIVLNRSGFNAVVDNLPTTEDEFAICTQSHHIKNEIPKVLGMIKECRALHGVVHKKKKFCTAAQSFTTQKRQNSNNLQGTQKKRPKVSQEPVKTLPQPNKNAGTNPNNKRAPRRFRQRRRIGDRRSQSPPANLRGMWIRQASGFSEESPFNKPNFVVLNPTNVPSAFTFQTPQNNQIGSFSQNSEPSWTQGTNGMQSSFKRFPNSQQVGNKFGSSTQNQDFRRPNSSFNRIDRRIDNLEKKFQRERPRNQKDRNFDNSSFRRRY